MTHHIKFTDPLHRKEKYSAMSTTTDPFTKVTVDAGTLQTTARLLEQLAEFFDMHPAAQVQLGHFLAARNEHAGDAAIEGTVTVGELTEAAGLLHCLATSGQEG
jgi:hypothetical protein